MAPSAKPVRIAILACPRHLAKRLATQLQGAIGKTPEPNGFPQDTIETMSPALPTDILGYLGWLTSAQTVLGHHWGCELGTLSRDRGWCSLLGRTWSWLISWQQKSCNKARHSNRTSADFTAAHLHLRNLTLEFTYQPLLLLHHRSHAISQNLMVRLCHGDRAVQPAW